MRKINSINFGGKMILAGILLCVIVPSVAWPIQGRFSWLYLIPGGIVLLAFIVVFVIEMKQDEGNVPYYERNLRETIPYDPKNQTPIIKASICTGEKVAGFKDKTGGKFTEVMVIRSEDDKDRFMKIYGLDSVSIEY